MTEGNILTSYTYQWLMEKGLCSKCSCHILNGQGINNLTKIQLNAIPRIIKKENVFLHARTGSGKTLAFLLPAIERLRAMQFTAAKGTGALIVSPTRELAQQIASVLMPLAAVHNFSILTLIGGKKVKLDQLAAGGVFVVGTPGRITEVLSSEVTGTQLRVNRLRILIFDEADRLFDGSTHTEFIRRICSYLPTEKVQKILVSATATANFHSLVKDVLNVALTVVSVETSDSISATDQVTQSYLLSSASERLSLLVMVLKSLRKKKTIVFFNSCDSVKFHYAICTKFDLPVMLCLGQQGQSLRSSTYTKFVEAHRGILLTTGLAERGWDVPGVKVIVQYDPPHLPENYIHRVGRTGRGEGVTGEAVLFLLPQEENFVRILRSMGALISQLEFGGDLEPIQQKIYELVDGSYELQESGRTAFRKHLKAYQCHKLKKTFRFDAIDRDDLSKSFGFRECPLKR